MTKTITTKSGFSCEIDTDAMDDMRLLDAIVEMESAEGSNKILYYNKIMDRLVPRDVKEALYKHIEDENGRVKTLAFKAELESIFEELGKKKS